MVLTSLLLLGLVAGVRPYAHPVTPAPAGCADTVQRAHTRVYGLLRIMRSADLPAFREVQAVDTTHLRLLTRDADVPVCSALRARVWPGLVADHVANQDWHFAVLEADGFYFVLLSRDWPKPEAGPSHRVRIGEQGPPTFYIFDHDLKLVMATQA
jgi:hypothetical protein